MRRRWRRMRHVFVLRFRWCRGLSNLQIGSFCLKSNLECFLEDRDVPNAEMIHETKRVKCGANFVRKWTPIAGVYSQEGITIIAKRSVEDARSATREEEESSARRHFAEEGLMSENDEAQTYRTHESLPWSVFAALRSPQPSNLGCRPVPSESLMRRSS